MPVATWWRKRLEEQNPIGDPVLWVPGFNVRPSRDPNEKWPRAVARQALYMDFVAWYENEYLLGYRKTEMYVRFPEQLPITPTELTFWMAIAPFLYLHGKKVSVRNYFVKKPVQHQGAWLQVKVRRYFVRLEPWQKYVDRYEVNTGRKLYSAPLSAEGTESYSYT